MKKLLIILLLFLTTTAYGQQKPMLGQQVDWTKTDAVAIWLLNEGAGPVVYDLSLNGNDGTFVNTPTWESGPDGSIISIVQGDNDYINCGVSSIFDITGAITIIAYVKGDNVSNGRILSKGENGANHGYLLGMTGSNGALRIGDNAGFVNGQIPNYSRDKFYTIAGTYDGSGTAAGYKLYSDGVDVTGAESGTANGFQVTTQPLIIGGELDDGAFEWPFGGDIGFVYLYNRALTASEIVDLYEDSFRFMVDEDDYIPLWYAALPTDVTFLNQVRHGNQKPMLGVRPYYDSLVGAYAFNEDSGNLVYDTSGNDNTGSLISLVTWVSEGLNFAGDDDYIDAGNTYGFTTED